MLSYFLYNIKAKTWKNYNQNNRNVNLDILVTWWETILYTGILPVHQYEYTIDLNTVFTVGWFHHPRGMICFHKGSDFTNQEGWFVFTRGVISPTERDDLFSQGEWFHHPRGGICFHKGSDFTNQEGWFVFTRGMISPPQRDDFCHLLHFWLTLIKGHITFIFIHC